MLFFAVKDTVTGGFPFYLHCQTVDELKRVIGDVLQDNNHQISRHFKDYQVYKVGEFDDKELKVVDSDFTFLFNVQEIYELLHGKTKKK